MSGCVGEIAESRIYTKKNHIMATTKEENDKKRSRTINVKAEKIFNCFPVESENSSSSSAPCPFSFHIGSFIVKIKMKEGRKKRHKPMMTVEIE